MGETQSERHPTEGLPDYEKQRHDAIQDAHKSYAERLEALNTEHEATLAGIEEHFQAAHKSGGGSPGPSQEIPY